MDSTEISRDGPKAAAAAEAPASAPDPAATPRMALAGLHVAASETPAEDTPTITLASIEAPNLTPDLDDLKSAADEQADGEDADASADERAPAHVSRFTLLAATLALAAALGGMVGALVAYGLARPGPASTITAPRADLAELQTLKENLVQARVDLAALKVGIESAARNSAAQFTRMGERIERIERLQGEPANKLNKAIDTLERLSRDAAQAKEVTGSIVPPGGPGRPEGWVVRDVRRGTALIEGRMGVIEVEQGDFVPGLGRVDAIRKQDGRWVVVTSKGLIMPAR
ncbi:MAG TPA: hypothetical protein VH934_24345 [Xanthobacteraceae bacterium]|jgi:hypothetical protein